MKRKAFAGTVLTCALVLGTAVCSYAAPAAQPAQGQNFAYEVPAEKPEDKEEAKASGCEEKESGFLEKIRESVDRFFNKEVKEEAVKEEKGQPDARGREKEQEISPADGRKPGGNPGMQGEDGNGKGADKETGNAPGNGESQAGRPGKPANGDNKAPEKGAGNGEGDVKPGAR